MKKIKTTYFLVFDRRKNLRIRKRPTYMDDGEFTIKLDIIVADKFFRKPQLFVNESVEIKEEDLSQLDVETSAAAVK